MSSPTDLCSSCIGFCYVLTNKHIPNLLKIGFSRKHPLQRVKELSAPTGVPDEYRLAYYHSYSDCVLAETIIHQQFTTARTNPNREFFQVKAEDVITFMQGLTNRPDYRAGLEAGEKELEPEVVEGGDMADDPLRREWASVAEVKTPMSELFATFPDDGGERELTEEEREKCRALQNR